MLVLLARGQCLFYVIYFQNTTKAYHLSDTALLAVDFKVGGSRF